jgi:hypothetical protein
MQDSRGNISNLLNILMLQKEGGAHAEDYIALYSCNCPVGEVRVLGSNCWKQTRKKTLEELQETSQAGDTLRSDELVD